MELIYKVNKNLEFKGIETMNEGELQIFVNNNPLTYIDLDNFGYDYEKDLLESFVNIIDYIIYELFQQNCLGDKIINFDDFTVIGLRMIKENY